MRQTGFVLVLLLVMFAAASTARPNAHAGSPECIDPTPGAGGELTFDGLNTPYHLATQHGDVCPGTTEEWTFRTIDVGIDQFLGVMLSEGTGDVSATVIPPSPGDPVVIGPGMMARFGPTRSEDVYTVRISTTGSSLATYTLQVCRSIVNPCPFQAGLTQIGDANCDNTVNASDAQAILLFVANVIPPGACANLADVDGDGRITSMDALLILQFIAGLVPALPIP